MLKQPPKQHIFIVNKERLLPVVYRSQNGAHKNKLTTALFEKMKFANLFCEFYLKTNNTEAYPKLVEEWDEVQNTFIILDKLGIEKVEFFTDMKINESGLIDRDSLIANVKDLISLPPIVQFGCIEGNVRVNDKP